MKRSTLALLVITILTTGCSTSSNTKKDTDVQPIPKNYKQLITSSVNKELKDPYSSKYTFSKPERTYACWKGHYWKVNFTINSKNSYGAYTGAKNESAFFKKGKLSGIGGCNGETLSQTNNERKALTRLIRRSLK